MGRWRAAPEGLARTPNRCTMSAMQRIGVDAVSVDRIALAVRRSGPGFLAKVYTPAELTYCNGNDERLAGRWAAKEAVIKCFDGTGICFPRRRIEVLPGPNGAPRARLLVATTIYPILAAKCTEVMATPVPEVAPGAVGHAAYDSILRQLESAEVGIIGPGLGRDSSTWRLVVDLALHAQSPLVIDADGLNALADSPRSKGKLGARRVLTPHPGE